MISQAAKQHAVQLRALSNWKQWNWDFSSHPQCRFTENDWCDYFPPVAGIIHARCRKKLVITETRFISEEVGELLNCSALLTQMHVYGKKFWVSDPRSCTPYPFLHQVHWLNTQLYVSSKLEPKLPAPADRPKTQLLRPPWKFTQWMVKVRNWSKKQKGSKLASRWLSVVPSPAISFKLGLWIIALNLPFQVSTNKRKKIFGVRSHKWSSQLPKLLVRQ